MFVNAQGPLPAVGFAFPDVCVTPVPVPVPIPYPNLAMRPTSIPTQLTCFTLAMPNHNLMTMQPMTIGDNAGVNLGVASGMVMGPSRNLTGSVKVFNGPAPVTRMLDASGHNGVCPNALGASLSPAQPVVMVLS